MMSSAAQDQGHNRSRPLCDRIVAHTAADCGNLEVAAKFLERLNNAENGLSFYRVPPLTAIAWRHLKSGDKAAAERHLDESSKAAADLPVEGVFSIDAAAWLAAALTAAGREKEAPRWSQDFRRAARRDAWRRPKLEPWRGIRTISTARTRTARCSTCSRCSCPSSWKCSVARGFPAEALRLAQSTPNESLRSECEIAWLEAVQRQFVGSQAGRRSKCGCHRCRAREIKAGRPGAKPRTIRIAAITSER